MFENVWKATPPPGERDGDNEVERTKAAMISGFHKYINHINCDIWAREERVGESVATQPPTERRLVERRWSCGKLRMVHHQCNLN